ncbi:hypothetical protein EVAR_5889_1 [Eumeta japonica]|uniref:Uncharacterized protein n=1 Tax=Eumeta variegata TaxID=151549 RepID=A0A4C1TCX4_EUMVA|nr:hypothetical protein EVAR_5889_1 [Eumeta japonica]
MKNGAVPATRRPSRGRARTPNASERDPDNRSINTRIIYRVVVVVTGFNCPNAEICPPEHPTKHCVYRNPGCLEMMKLSCGLFVATKSLNAGLPS